MLPVIVEEPAPETTIPIDSLLLIVLLEIVGEPLLRITIPFTLLLLIALSKSNDSFANTFTNFEIGFYIIAIASVSILIFGLTLADKKTQISGTNQNNQIFCSKCGKQYSSTSSGEFCEACGNKLN